MIREPVDLPPIVSMQLIQISDKTNIPYAPKARKVIEKVKKEESDSKRKDYTDAQRKQLEALEKNIQYGFSIQDIESVKITLSDFKYKKYWACKVDIVLNDGTTRVIDNTYIYNLELSNKDLKSIGGKGGVSF